MTRGRQTRLERWKDPRYASVGFRIEERAEDHTTSQLIERLEENRKLFYSERKEEFQDLWSDMGLARAAREIIFDVVDGKPVFHYIMYSFNVSRAQLEVSHLLDGLVDTDDEASLSDSIRHTLAVACALDVPVYPNTEELAPQLVNHYRELLLEGFTAPDEKGRPIKLKLVRTPQVDVTPEEYIEGIDVTEMLQPAQIVLIRDSLLDEVARLGIASAVLTRIQLGIAELEECLEADTANEANLQTCLTRNPILFGVEYSKVLPKHRLGDDYEMDYALRRVSGLVDLVEIEASTHRLFKQNGDPTAAVIHAEQQVLDWLAWMERHHAYTREKLPGIVRPMGYVVIGRSTTLSDAEHDRLNQRNQLHRGALRTLTFDMLLDRAKNLTGALAGDFATEEGSED